MMDAVLRLMPPHQLLSAPPMRPISIIPVADSHWPEFKAEWFKEVAWTSLINLQCLMLHGARYGQSALCIPREQKETFQWHGGRSAFAFAPTEQAIAAMSPYDGNVEQ
eukprot:1159224-Pelagomonas_calceolata.AAC.5